MGWAERGRDGDRALPRRRGRELDQRQLTQLGNTAWAAGLSLLMAGQRDEAADWLRRAAGRYRESWEAGAPPDSWGRPIAAMKALLLAGDDASDAARWALDAGAREAESPIGRYAGTLALLVLGDDAAARALGSTLRDRDDFPRTVADASSRSRRRPRRTTRSRSRASSTSFEQRSDFLEDVPSPTRCSCCRSSPQAGRWRSTCRGRPLLPA